MLSTAVAGLAVLIAVDTAAAQNAAAVSAHDWKPIVYTNLQEPSSQTAAFADIWSKEIGDNDRAYVAQGDLTYEAGHAPATEAHFVVRSPEKTAVLSLLSTATGCIAKQQDASGQIGVRLCPLKIAVYQGRAMTVNSGRLGCFVQIAAGADTEGTGTMVSYDASTRSIKIGTMVRHEPVPGCAATIPIYEQLVP